MDEQLLRLPEVLRRTGLSKSTVYAKVKAGEFPKPIAVGAKTSCWILSEVQTWIADTIAAARTTKGAGRPSAANAA